jgi:hypothetical protein
MELEKINCMTKTMASELKKNGITTVEALATRSISEFKEWVDKGWILNVGLNQLIRPNPTEGSHRRNSAWTQRQHTPIPEKGQREQTHSTTI